MAQSAAAPKSHLLLELLFFLGFALLVGHEIDAVAQAEWRLLPLLSALPDDQGFQVYVCLHVPLVAVLMWLTGAPNTRVRRPAQFGVDAFLIIHVGLHLLFSGHEDYSFHSTLSEFLIFGAGAVGLTHALLAAGWLRSRGS